MRPGETGTVRGRASDLLRLPVRLHGIRVGRPQDLRLERGAGRAVGIDVLCNDGVVRFLPLAAARTGAGALVIESPFLLVDHDARSFYRRGTVTLGELRGCEVVGRGRTLGRIADVELAGGGAVAAFLLEGGERVEAGEDVGVLVDDAASAA